MTTVGIVDGLRYGFRYLAVLVGVVLLSGAFVAGGGALAYTGLDFATPMGSEVLPVVAGGFVALVGLVVFHGMLFGLLYKFLADSVVAGVEAADLAVTLPDDATITVEDTAEGDAAVTGRAATVSASDTAEETGAVHRPAQDDGGVDDPGTHGPATGDESVEHREPAVAAEDSGSGVVERPDAQPVGEATGTDPEPTAPDSAAEGTTGGAEAAGGDPPTEQTAAEPTGEELDRVVSEATQPGSEESATTLFEEGPTGEGTGSVEEQTADEDDQTGGADMNARATEGNGQAGVPDDEADEQPETTDPDPVPDAQAEGPVEDATPTGEPGEPVAGPDDGTTEDHPGATDAVDDPVEADPLGMGTTGGKPDPSGAPETDTGPGDGPAADSGHDGGHGADDDPPGGTEPAGEPVDDAPGDAGGMESTDDGGDVIDEAFEEADEATNPIADLDDGDVEDTTDEPGDWEPLDESDLKD